MKKLKVAVMGWEPPFRGKVKTGAGMYLSYLAELGLFSRARGKKVCLTFICPAEKNSRIYRRGYKVIFVHTPGFREDNPYAEDVLYPTSKKFAERLLGRRKPVDLREFDLVFVNSFAFGELIARTKSVNFAYISHRPEFLREDFAKRFGLKFFNKRRLRRDAKLEEKSIRNSKHVVTVSKACKRVLTRKYNRPVDVIYNGVDTRLFKRMQTQTNGKTVFIYTGRNHPEKGVDLLLQAAKLLANRGRSDFEIRLYTDDGISLKRSAKKYGISEKVKIMGWWHLHELPHQYSSSTFSIMPSYWESFSYSVVEGMACGVPAIVSSAGALPEIVNEENGFVFKTGEVDELADLMEEVCKFEPRHVNEMGQKGISLVKKRFSKENFLENYLTFIDKAVA